MDTCDPATDADLLAAYDSRGDESAFAALVRRHETLVHATCWRRLQNAALAQDAAQMTFLLLAQKARSLRGHPNLAGWLYQTANFQASNLLKKEISRAKAAASMEESAVVPDPSETDVPAGEEHLDDALLALREPEREAVVLRFFSGRSLREVGDVQGTSEDAARKRISRALERMADFLRGRGAAQASVAGIPALLATPAQAAPAGFASLVVTSAQSAKLASAAGANAAWWLKLKIATAVVVTAAIPIVGQWIANRNLQAENDRLRARQEIIASSLPVIVEDAPVSLPLRAGSFRESSAPEPNRLLQLLDALLAAESAQRQTARLGRWLVELRLTEPQVKAAEAALQEATQVQRDALHALSNGDVQFDRVMEFLRAETAVLRHFAQTVLTPTQATAFAPLQDKEQLDLAKDLAQWRLADLQFTLRLLDSQKQPVLDALATSTLAALTELVAPEIRDMPALLGRLAAIGAREHAAIAGVLSREQLATFNSHTEQRRKALDFLFKDQNP